MALSFGLPKNVPGSADIGSLSLPEKLMMLGATLRGDSDAALKIPMLAQARQQQANLLATQRDLGELIGGGRSAPAASAMPQLPALTPPQAPADPYAGVKAQFGAMQGDEAPPPSVPLRDAAKIDTPPPMIPLNMGGSSQASNSPAAINMRAAAPLLAKLAMIPGANVENWVKIIQGAQPDMQFVNGVGVDTHDPTNLGRKVGANLSNVNGFMVDTQDQNNAGRYMPKLADGATPLYDENHRIVAQKLLDGTVQAMEASSEADARGKARGGLVTVPMRNGSNRMMTGAAFMDGQGGASPDGLGVSQSPAEQKADEQRATAQAGAQIDLPANVQTANQALDLIDQIRANPALDKRTGLWSVLPSMPGTAGKDFDVQLDQLKGKLFLQAYSGLKGAGQITEVEGKKATEAIGRLNRSQSHDGFVQALGDLESVIKAGRDRATYQARRTDLAPGSGGAGAPSRDAVRAEMIRRGLIHQ